MAQEDDVDVDVVVNEDDETNANAEDDTYEDDYDVHEVTTSYYIPDYPDGRLPVGKPVTILVDFANKGQDVFNVTRVAAFLHSPYDLNYYIQNFTAKAIGGVAAPSAQIGLEYKVTPDEKLEPLEFWLSGFVEYTMEGSDEPYTQMFVNTTVELFDDKSSFDIASFLTTFMVLAGLGMAAYTALSAGAKKVTGKKSKYVAPRPSAAVDDWNVEAYKQGSSKVRGRKKISKK